MAVCLVRAHLAVARIPEVGSFRVQPDKTAAFFLQLFQYLVFGITVIGSAVSDNNQGGLFVENVQVIFFKLPKR